MRQTLCTKSLLKHSNNKEIILILYSTVSTKVGPPKWLNLKDWYTLHILISRAARQDLVLSCLLCSDRDMLLQRLQQLVFVCFLSLGNGPVSPLWCERKSAYLLPLKPNILPFDEQKENFAMCYVTKHFTWVSVDSDQWDHVLWTDVWSKTYLYLFVYFISEH